MFTSGLLVLTSPLAQLTHRTRVLLKHAFRYVDKTLYIHVTPELFHPVNTEPGSQPVTNKVPVNKEVIQLILGLFSQASNISKTEVRVLLENMSNDATFTTKPYTLHHGYEVVFTEQGPDSSSVLPYVQKYMPVVNPVEHQVINVEPNKQVPVPYGIDTLGVYQHVVLGGTFDHLHVGHKILLTFASMKCCDTLTVGISDEAMIGTKTLTELIQPMEERITAVEEFLKDVKPSLTYNIVPIQDPFGPAIIDPMLECIVVSEETIQGGAAVNKRRVKNGLNELAVTVVPLLKDATATRDDDSKVSSSTIRKRSLGLLRTVPFINIHLPKTPYIIGMSGGIASGKSSICQYLQTLGAGFVDCDKLGHAAYEPGTATFDEVVEEFGQEVVGKDKHINRQVLGAKCFAEPEKMEKLNRIVWPAIVDLAKAEIIKITSENPNLAVVVVEAAMLLEAGMTNMVHEVWVCIIPEAEAVKRLQKRNFTEAEAMQRIQSQLSNSFRVDAAHIVFSTFWDHNVTYSQVDRAWNNLLERMAKDGESSSLYDLDVDNKND